MGLVPSESVTCAWTSPDVPDDGVVKVKESGVRALIVVGLPAKLRVVPGPGRKSDPVTVTSSPPDAGPAAGDSDEIVGPAYVYRPTKVFQQEGAVVQVPPMLPSATSVMTHTSEGCAGSCTAAE